MTLNPFTESVLNATSAKELRELAETTCEEDFCMPADFAAAKTPLVQSGTPLWNMICILYETKSVTQR